MNECFPISQSILEGIKNKLGLPVPGKSSIREIVHLVNVVEQETGIKFIRMEMGVPGLKAPEIAVNAEIEALKKGVASIYPPIEGVAELKYEASRFLKLFLNIGISPSGCIPTCGSMQGSYLSFLTINRTDPERDGTLFIDPCFPVHKQQCRILNAAYESFDIYDYRGFKLREKLLSYLKKGKICSILYSNPNNPSWICFTEEELQIIGELASEYNVIVLEDLAYFGMDFRKDYSVPGSPPFQPTVARYTDNYVLFISTSKVFSYAGQRIGIMAISDKIFNNHYPGLKRFYTSDTLGHTMIYGSLYAISAGTSHSPQIAAAALFKAMNDGTHNFIQDVKEYGERAKRMKELFLSNGFNIVYDTDGDSPIADGFYFTISYPGFSGAELLEELIYYGISAITLDITGSTRTEGLRACVSQVDPVLLPVLEERLQLFFKDHP
jgi:aspartate/methionine/tyrosine aminotransferase